MKCTNDACPNLVRVERYRNKMAQLGLLLDRAGRLLLGNFDIDEMRKIVDSEKTVMHITIEEDKEEDSDAG